MPLKLYPPRKGKTPYWSVRGTYLGVYVDRSTKAGKRAIAAQALKRIESEIERGEFAGRGEPTFASAAVAYMKAGGEARFLRPLLDHFGERPLREIDQTAIDHAATALYPNASAATRNRQVYTPVSALLRHVGHRIDLRRPKGAQGNKATAWLWPEEAERLFVEAEKIDAEFGALLIVLCYTGLRLSEALKLTWADVRLSDAFGYVPDTKSGDPRPVFLPPVVVATLANLQGQGNANERLFRFAKSGHLYSLLRMAFARANLDLPERSAYHVFRHTYATWMRRYGGVDTRGLIGTGAWKDRKSVDRYEHVVIGEDARRAALLPTRRIRGNG